MISLIALLGGALLIALAVVNGLNRPAPPPIAPAPAVAGTFSGLPTDGFALGRADAPVTIDLYEDFQCPACRRWGEVVFPSLAANELADGTARLVFHDFAFLGPESFDAARAGHAAARQGHFWEFWAAAYARQGHENSGALATPTLVEIAKGLGLDVDRFTADMAPAAAASAVNDSNAAAQRLGVNSTPTVVIDGRLLPGAGYDEIAAAIAEAAAD